MVKNEVKELHEEEALLPDNRPVTDDLELLLAAMPENIQAAVQREGGRADLLEIVLDLGRLPEARYRDREVLLSKQEVTDEDLQSVIARIGTFGSDNRAGIERTLHRISVIRNRAGKPIGLTCRVGRAVFGTIGIIKDLVESGQSILLVGRPGVGKTTLLRETGRVLADELHKRVIIVDTSNEIAGDGDIPHPAIGRARRMQVARPDLQHNVMIEAVENHMPQVIVIDEIGTQLEAEAARTINERGVQLIGTAHGISLENLMLNPTLSDLIGGIQSVTLGDDEARRRGTQKSVLERKAPPTFDTMVEIRDRDRVAVHLSVADTVDSILRGQPYTTQIRYRTEDGRIEIYEEQSETDETGATSNELTMTQLGFGLPSNNYSGRGRPQPMNQPLSGGPTRTNRGTTANITPINRGVAVASNVPTRSADSFFGLGGNSATTGNGSARPAASANGNGNATLAYAALKPLRIYPHGVNRGRLENVVRQMSVPADLVRDITDADVVLTLKSQYRQKPLSLRHAENENIPIYILKSNTAAQMEQIIAQVFGLDVPTHTAGDDDDEVIGELDMNSDPVKSAIIQTEEAVHQVMNKGQPVELPPQNAFIRRLQHQIAERYNLLSQSRGREPFRRVKIYPQ
jgi:stage III sporulation protein SpoIIIAA